MSNPDQNVGKARFRAFLLIFAVTFVFLFVMQWKHSINLKQAIAEQEQGEILIAEATLKNEETQRRINFSETLEYAEQEARSALGFMKPGEIHFVQEQSSGSSSAASSQPLPKQETTPAPVVDP